MTPRGGPPEVVSLLFCGSSEDPLLVQRIGRNREAAARAADPTPTPRAARAAEEVPTSAAKSGAAVETSGETSGAAAAPSLGYAQRRRSESERLLVEAAEAAMARLWQGGKTASLPLPPPGFQWDIVDLPLLLPLPLPLPLTLTPAYP